MSEGGGPVTEAHLISQRKRKLKAIREMGIVPYPYSFQVTHQSREIRDNFELLEKSEIEVAVAGRLTVIRGHGKAAFSDLRDGRGRIQIYVRMDVVGKMGFELWKLLDIGDFIGVFGVVFLTRTGEVTVKVRRLELLSKAVRPLPVPKEEMQDGKRVIHDAFNDVELRYRRRYLDLALNPETQEIFRKRAAVVSAIRKFLDFRGFLEVETPVLQPLYGGAFARPFRTHHNSLGIPLFLRISDELYLKRLIVGGYERVYEICKDFRNEGIDRTHNPEFTMVELYQAYADYTDMIVLTEELIVTVAQEVNGSTVLTYQGQEVDLSPPWHRVSMLEAIETYIGEDVRGASVLKLQRICERLELEIGPYVDSGKMIDQIFEACVQPNLVQPTFVTDYPVETSPLAKRHRKDPDLTERFEPFIFGGEIGNAFSELNDPIDQRQRFEQQNALREQGDEEAQVLDEDYLRAMEYGMPPMGGLGIGVDRLVMLLTDSSSIRDVILFPQMRPEEGRFEIGEGVDE